LEKVRGCGLGFQKEKLGPFQMLSNAVYSEKFGIGERR
jgi:hypothetical protein